MCPLLLQFHCSLSVSTIVCTHSFTHCFSLLSLPLRIRHKHKSSKRSRTSLLSQINMHIFTIPTLLALLNLTAAQMASMLPILTSSVFYHCTSRPTTRTYPAITSSTIPITSPPEIGGSSASASNPSNTNAATPPTTIYFVTTYTVTYTAVCPTGLTQSTYTITESCPGGKSNYVTPTGAPPGFTVTARVCEPCAAKDGPTNSAGQVVVTVTEPIATMSAAAVTGADGKVLKTSSGRKVVVGDGVFWSFALSAFLLFGMFGAL